MSSEHSVCGFLSSSATALSESKTARWKSTWKMVTRSSVSGLHLQPFESPYSYSFCQYVAAVPGSIVCPGRYDDHSAGEERRRERKDFTFEHSQSTMPVAFASLTSTLVGEQPLEHPGCDV